MQMNQIYLATAKLLKFIMNGTEGEIIRILDIDKHIKVTILILFATRNRTKDTYSLDLDSLSKNMAIKYSASLLPIINHTFFLC